MGKLRHDSISRMYSIVAGVHSRNTIQHTCAGYRVDHPVRDTKRLCEHLVIQNDFSVRPHPG